MKHEREKRREHNKRKEKHVNYSFNEESNLFYISNEKLYSHFCFWFSEAESILLGSQRRSATSALVLSALEVYVVVLFSCVSNIVQCELYRGPKREEYEERENPWVKIVERRNGELSSNRGDLKKHS